MRGGKNLHRASVSHSMPDGDSKKMIHPKPRERSSTRRSRILSLPLETICYSMHQNTPDPMETSEKRSRTFNATLMTKVGAHWTCRMTGVSKVHSIRRIPAKRESYRGGV